jgi:hypothetical protein
VAAAGAAEKDRELVADESTAAAGETGGRLVKRARYYWLLLAESGLTRRLFCGDAGSKSANGCILDRTGKLKMEVPAKFKYEG